MSCGCGCGGTTCRFTSMNAERLKGTLGRCLIPSIDAARDIKVQLGLMPYRVSIVRTRWSGGRRGLGQQLIVGEFEILPTPKVTDLSALNEIVQSVGREAYGSVMVSKISGRYTEDQLRGQDIDGQPIGEDEQVFWEVEFLASPGEKWRFVTTSVPAYLPMEFGWTIKLERAVDNRTRDGAFR